MVMTAPVVAREFAAGYTLESLIRLEEGRAVKPRPDPPSGSPNVRGDEESRTSSTAELLNHAREGDQAAQAGLLSVYLPRLKRWATGRLPAGARGLLDTDDIVQDAALRVLGHLQEFEPRGPGAFQTYLRETVLNRIRDEYRRSRRQHPERLGVDKDPSPEASPLEQTVGRETLRRYEEALARLRAEDREIVVSRVEFDWGYREIAEFHGKVSADAARMAVRRALLRLAEEMGHEG